MNLVLVGENKDLVVECLNDEFEFVHNTMDGSNWFNQKTLASMFGVSVVNISRLLNTYSKRINGSNDFLTKPLKVHIRLKTNESNQKIKFYNLYNCLELLRTKNDWNDRFDVVNKQINGKIDNTKQLTF